MTFASYFRKIDKDIDHKKSKLNELQHNLRWNKDKESLITLPSQLKKIAIEIEKFEKNIEDIEKEIMRLQYLYENIDELVKEYLLTLPANRKNINLCDIFEQHSLTVVPDLSRFTELRHLDLSMNRCLSSGFDRLPTTLKRLNCIKTNIPNEDTAWILRLVNLESLNLCRNDNIRELPDLSSLENLTDVDLSLMSLRSLPSMPLNNITLLRIPVQELPRYYSKTVYVRAKTVSLQTFECLTKSHSSKIIRHINRINQFDRIREELIATGAKIILNPSRIAKLLDQSEIDLDSDWSDIFECQTRRVHTTVYSS
jgi:hypothetical protein